MGVEGGKRRCVNEGEGDNSEVSVIMGLGTRKSMRHIWMVRGGCVRYVERFKFSFRVGDQWDLRFWRWWGRREFLNMDNGGDKGI